MKRRILGVNVSNRVEVSDKVQKLLTSYGCSIRTRLGLHEVDETWCGPGGLILLELIGDITEWERLEGELSGIPGVEVHRMDFNNK